MADDPDSGESFMRKHMSEAQLSQDEGAFKGPKPTAPKYTDSYYSQKYGKDIDLTSGPPGDLAASDTVRVNRRAQGDKSPGSRRSSRDKSINYD